MIPGDITDGRLEWPATEVIVFVDSAVEGYTKLLAGQGLNSEVVILDEDRDGVRQITEILSERDEVAAIHILSHGASGRINLGTAALCVSSLSQYADDFATWGRSISDQGDILLYGCSVGAGPAGKALLDGLGGLTEADVAASIDPTGPAELGGDWVLEAATGQVEASSLADGTIACVRSLLAAGDLDLTFGRWGTVTTPIGSSEDYARSIAIQSDGKIVVAGYSYNDNDSDFALARYNPDGSLDTSFGLGGKVTTPIGSGWDQAYSMAIQSDGKIVVAGYSYNDNDSDFALARYNPDGSLDTSFGAGGRVTTAIGSGTDEACGVAIQSNGKIVVAGLSSNGSNFDFALARYNPNGSLDTSFGLGGKVITSIGPGEDGAYGVAIQSDGKIVVAGWSYSGSNPDFALARYNPNGSLDTSFGLGGKVITPIGSDWDEVRSIAIQSDGKIVVAGWSSNGSNSDFALARYNPNGSLDTSFGLGGKVITPIGSDWDQAYSVAIQSDGKIVVGGGSDRDVDAGVSRPDFALVRYNSDGSLDTSFGAGGKATAGFGDSADTDIGGAVAIQSDGRIVVAGWSDNGGTSDFALARFQAEDEMETAVHFVDGNLEAAVETALGVTDPTPRQMLGLTWLTASYARIYDLTGLEHARDLTELTLDRNNIRDLSPLSGLRNLRVLHLLENGIHDVSALLGLTNLRRLDLRSNPLSQQAYATDLPQIEMDNPWANVQYDLPGRIEGWKWHDRDRNGVWDPGEPGLPGWTIYLDQDLDGILDTGEPSAVTQPDGSYTIPYLSAQTYYTKEVDESGWVRTSPPILPQIVALGLGQVVGNKNFGSTETGNWPGNLDATFGTGGIVTGLEGYNWSVALQSDGRIVMAGTSYPDFAVARYNPDGSVDRSFGIDGMVTTPVGYTWGTACDVAVQSDGRIVVAGWCDIDSGYAFALVRYSTDGSLDTSFGANGKVTTSIGSSYDQGWSVAIQPDGKIVVAGRSDTDSGSVFAVARYNTDGSLDTSFGVGGTVTTQIGASLEGYSADIGWSVVIQPDGKIVVAGTSLTGYDNYDFAVARYNTNGSLDASFGVGGRITTDVGDYRDQCYSVALQSDGKIVAAGASHRDLALVRYNTNGSLDTSFGIGGKLTTQIGASVDSESARSVVIQPDGKIVVAGDIRQLFPPYYDDDIDVDFALVRYNTDGALDTSFGIGGKITTSIGDYDYGQSIALQSDGKIVVAGNNGGYSALARYLGGSAEITVWGNANSISDGDASPSAADHTDFGGAVQGGSTIGRTFTVRNDGTATLTLGSVSVPTGFTLTEGLSDSLAPGVSDTFTVQLDAAVSGVKRGDVSFTTNDSDESPFNFQITGMVTRPQSPDLSWYSLSGSPTRVAAGGILTVSRNYRVSTAAAGPDFAIVYRLSTNGTWGDADDVLLTPQENITTTAGKTVGLHSGTFGVAVPTSIPLRSYYLLARLDSADAVAESNEANNVRVASLITVTVPPSPDLSWYGLSGSPTRVAAGGSLTVNRNYRVSTLAAGPDFVIQYRLSANGTWGDADDVIVTEESITTTAGKTVGLHSGTYDIKVPASATPRSYYLLAKLDHANAVAESSETNNIRVASLITVTVPPSPDLSWYSLSGSPTRVAAGGSLTVNRNYRVSTLAAGPDFTIQYRLSVNQTWGDADDVILAEENITTTAGKTVGLHSDTFGVTVPASTTPRSYYLLARLDHADAVAEYNETNNAKLGSLIVVTGAR